MLCCTGTAHVPTSAFPPAHLNPARQDNPVLTAGVRVRTSPRATHGEDRPIVSWSTPSRHAMPLSPHHPMKCTPPCSTPRQVPPGLICPNVTAVQEACRLCSRGNGHRDEDLSENPHDCPAGWTAVRACYDLGKGGVGSGGRAGDDEQQILNSLCARLPSGAVRACRRAAK